LQRSVQTSVASRLSNGRARVPAATPRKPDKPILWIVAGPNGSGKSSLYNRSDIEGWGGSVWIINPDLLTAKIVESEGFAMDAANLASVQRIEAWLERSIDTYQTIGVETVLSSPKYRRLVDLAHSRGFEVRMIFVLLRTLDLQLSRIRQRVSDGGHDVPADKVASRRSRSFEQLAWFAEHVDRLFVYDNSDGTPTLLGIKDGRHELTFLKRPPTELIGALLGAGKVVKVDRQLRI
jgi:predicted ABC-type ATPase